MQEIITNTNKRIPMFFLLISAISGILLGKYCVSYLTSAGFIGIFFIFTVYFLIRKLRVALILTLLLLIIAIFAFYYSYRDTSERNQQNIFSADKSILILARGYLLNEPQPRNSSDSSLIIPSVFNHPENEIQSYKYSKPVSTFNFRVQGYSDGKTFIEVNEKIKIFADSIFPELPVGELIEIPLKIYTPYAPSNPCEFDFRSYERETGIMRHGIYQCNQGFTKLEMPFLLRISPSVIASKIRSELAKKAMKLPPKQSAIFLTLTIGESESLSSKVKEEFKHTGTLHLLVISGLHIGFLIIIIEIVLRILRITHRKRAVFIIIVLLFFWILVGHKVALSRSIVFALIYYFGIVLKKPVNFPNVLSASAFFVLIINPFELFHLGFYLSFSAVFFITYTGFRITKKFSEIPKERFHISFIQKIFYKPVKYLKNSFMISIAGLISTAPMIWFSFGLITPGSILMNIFAIPLMFFILSFGMFVIILEAVLSFVNIILGLFSLEFLLNSIFSSLSELFIYFSGIAIDVLLKIEKAVVNTPGCYFYEQPVSILGMLLLILFFLCLFFRRKLRVSRTQLIIASSIILAFIVYEITWLKPENNNELIVTQFAFGENSDVIVETPEKESFVFTSCKQDSDNSYATMIKYLQKKRFKEISAIFITSAKGSTLNSLVKLLNNFAVRRIIITPYFARSYLGNILIKQLSGTPVKILFASAGVTINQGKKVRFDFWAPQKQAKINDEFKIETSQETVIAIRGEFGNIVITPETSDFGFDSQLDFIRKNNIDINRVPLVLMNKIKPSNKLFGIWLEFINPKNIFNNSKYQSNETEPVKLADARINLYDTSKSGALTYTYNFNTKTEQISTFR